MSLHIRDMYAESLRSSARIFLLALVYLPRIASSFCWISRHLLRTSVSVISSIRCPAHDSKLIIGTYRAENQWHLDNLAPEEVAGDVFGSPTACYVQDRSMPHIFS